MTPENSDSRADKALLKYALLTLFVCAGIFAVQYLFDHSSDNADLETTEKAEDPIELRYGFNVDHHAILEDEIKANQFLSELLTSQGTPHRKVYELVENIKDEFDVRQIRAGKKCCFIAPDLCSPASHFVYEPSPLHYYVFDLNECCVQRIDRPVTIEIDMAAGQVEGSLWASMESEGFSWALIERMENALAWSLDFYSIQNGDEYKLIYEKKIVDGEVVAIGDLLGAYYKNYDNEYYAVYYENDHYTGFYDLEGRPTKRTFLKAPVKYSRVSSGYSSRRFHPVLKRYKSHLGTDYAAPTGTPIMAVANGVVTNASYSKGNGKYVKIKHDKSYQTQYLHMSRFAAGIKSGVHVKQGQVIGYVGQTGLATGPHVCFRFWKNGKQVNHRRLNFPPSDPLPDDELPDFMCAQEPIKEALDAIIIETKEDSKLTLLEER